jgi:carboxymethylenebutenolidase
MNEENFSQLGLYSHGMLNRRELLKSVITLCGSCAAAHLFLEASGLGAAAITQREFPAGNVNARRVEYPSGQFQIEAYLVKPQDSGKHPAIIVIHENRGLNEHFRDVARRFASEGFVVLAPDLLSRVGGTAKMTTPGAAARAIDQISPSDSVADLRASFSFLEKDPAVDSGKISSIGYGWGGWRSFMLATEIPALYRAVVFYGATPASGLDRIQAPVLAHYAQLDHHVTGNAILTEKMMRQSGKKYTYYVYSNANQAFCNDTGPSYDPEAAKLAWKRTLDFLRS